MHICFVSLGNFTHIGAYIEYFKSAGHKVSFVSLAPGPDYDVDTYNVGIGTRYSGTKGKWKYPLSMIRARRVIHKLKPDILHAHYATSGGLAGLVCGFHPIIVTAHGTDLVTGSESPIWRPLLKLIFHNADCVNTVSVDLEEKALSLGIRPDKITTLPLGIDTTKFSFLSCSPITCKQKLNLVCTRRLENVYNHSTILKALAIVRKKGMAFRMVFVGHGVLQQDLQRQARDLGLEKDVHFMGGVDNSELPGILHRSDVYLSASLWDGASLCLLEAMATGVFPIVSDIKANSTWLRHGVDAFLHGLRDHEQLAEYILKVRQSTTLLQGAALRNRRLVVDQGDRQRNMAKLEDIYRLLIGTS